MNSEARFTRTLDSQFTHLGREAFYNNRQDPPFAILVIARRPEKLFELGEVDVHAEDPQLEFRLSEVPSPVRGDEIELGGKLYRIEAEPRLDLHQLVWITETLAVN